MNIATTALSVVIATAALAPAAAVAETNTVQLTPFEVTTRAYQGNFSDAGVPGYGALEAGVATGNIMAEDVIEAAIATGELSADSLGDRAFVRAVDAQLDHLIERN